MNCTWTEARSLFLSDLHLGWRYSNGFQAAEILSQCSPEFLYLIGDTFEWLHHPHASSKASIENFLQVLGRLSAQGTRIFLLPGNHAGEAVSSFFHLPPRPGTESILRIGVLLRQLVLDFALHPPAPAGHILVYIRRHAPDSLWRTLERSGRPSIVYGCGDRPSAGSIQFKRIADFEFVRDLAAAECLISTAGNQLVGEAIHLNKPILAIPEDGNFEQIMNAWLVEKSGVGWCTTFQQLTPHYLQQFLVAVPSLRRRLEQLSVCGDCLPTRSLFGATHVALCAIRGRCPAMAI